MQRIFWLVAMKQGNGCFPVIGFKVLNNAIDAKQYIYNPEKEQYMKSKLGIQGKFVLGHVGRFSPQKNHNFLIDVFQYVEKLEKKMWY